MRPPRLLFAELKVPPDKVKPEQLVWLDLLARVPGSEVWTFTPDEVVEMLEVLR